MATPAEVAELHRAISGLGCASPPAVDALQSCVAEGGRSPSFTRLVSWLCDECAAGDEVEEKVHATAGADDAPTFAMEVAGFTKALGCPHAVLHSSADRLSTAQHNALLLRYLVAEVQCARMTAAKEQAASAAGDAAKGDAAAAVAKAPISESTTAATLRELCQSVALSRPPDTVTERQLFDKLKAKLSENIAALGPAAVGRPLFSGTLTEGQWRQVDKCADDLNSEYSVRADLLLKRVDVTVQSFAWSDRVKKMEEEMVRIYRPRRQKLVAMCHTSVADLLAAREAVLHVEKTSSALVLAGTRTKLTKIRLKGRVPDRGGRPDEMRAPPPEMPQWQQRQGGPPGGRGGGGRGGGGARHHSPRGGARGGRGGGFANYQPQHQQHDNRLGHYQQQQQPQPQAQPQPVYAQSQGQYNAYGGGGGGGQWGQPPAGHQGYYNQAGGNYFAGGGGGQYQMSAQYVDPYAQQGNYDQFAGGYNQQQQQGYGYQQQQQSRTYQQGGRGRGGGRGRRY